MDFMNDWGLLNSLINIINEGSDGDTDVILSKFFLQNYNRIHELNVYDIAEECYVNRVTVRRLAQRLGYSNFKNLKEQFNNFHDKYNFYRFGIQTDIEGQSVATQLYKMALECDRHLTPEFLDHAVTKLNKSNQIIFLTFDVYSNQCSEFQKAMILSGKIVRVVSNKFKNNLVLKNMCQDDLLIVLSVSGFFSSVSVNLISSINACKVLITTIHEPLYEKCYNEIWYLSSSDQPQRRSVYTIFAFEYYLENIYTAYIKKYVHQ